MNLYYFEKFGYDDNYFSFFLFICFVFIFGYLILFIKIMEL